MNNPYPISGEPVPPQGTEPELNQGRMVQVQLPNTKPVVTYVLMALTVLIYLLQLASQYLLKLDIPFLLGAKVNELIAAGQVWRLFTPMLLHGSILHIGFNMYALYVFGLPLERYYGHGRYLAMYILAGFAGNTLSFAFSSAVALGASTAIFGLLGAEGVFLYRNWKIFGESAKRSLQNLIILAAINLIIGLAGNFDNWGHVGGLLGGAAFAWLAGPVLKLEMGFGEARVVDTHSTKDAWIAGALIAAACILLTVIVILLRK